MTYDELIAESDALRAKAAEIRAVHVADAVRKIKDLMDDYSLTAHDIGLPKSALGGANVAKASKPAKPSAVAKHTDPETGKSWSGRGRPPAWFKASSGANGQSEHA